MGESMGDGRVNTPYDDVFRTLLNDCTSLIIPVINEVFGEHYTGSEQIVFSPNEHFVNRQDGDEVKRITDSSFVVLGIVEKSYLFECQSTADSSMLVRIFEYAAQIALDSGKLKENTLKVKIPHSAVLFLRSGASDPDRMKIEIETPGGAVKFDVPVMKAQRYGIDEMFEKKLLFLIPFYIFSHESRLAEYNKDEEKLECLKAEYTDIINRLEALTQSGDISVYTAKTIIDMTNKVVKHIAKKYEEVREGVKAVMGGRILEYEAKAIKNEGRKEGINEGVLKTLFDLVKKNLLSIKDAASQAELTEDAFVAKMQAYKG